MSLPAPKLDSRTFKDLVDEARERIPRYTPEWTNLNDSDPGMTLVKLHAWMSETILYELNRVPDLNYIKFLDLIGIKPRPPEPARAEITFTLDALSKPTDPLVVPVPMGAKLAVDDPDLPVEVTFETDRSLVAHNAAVGMIVTAPKGIDGKRQLMTRYDETVELLGPFAPFDESTPARGAMYLGLLVRPKLDGAPDTFLQDTLTAGPLDLYFDGTDIYDAIPDGEGGVTPFEGPVLTKCQREDAVSSKIEWQVWTGTGTPPETFPQDASNSGWTTLSLSRDDTNGLTRSGHVVLEIPRGAVPLSPNALSSGFWADFGGRRPPQTKADLLDAIADLGKPLLDGLSDDIWAKMGVTDVDLLAACNGTPQQAETALSPASVTLTPQNVSQTDWVEAHPDFVADLPIAADEFRPMYWLRARLKSTITEDDIPPAILQDLRLNTVPSTQAATQLDERLGSATGRPSEQFTLSKAPVLIEPQTGLPALELTVGETSGTPWQRVEDFYKSGPADPHYILDPAKGTVTFGDGRRGQIPVAGQAITATRYRTGGGSIGNVRAGVISKIKGKIRLVKSAVNKGDAHGGSDGDDLESVKLRAPHDLRHRDRAVSAQDFADLALETPGVNLHKAYALAGKVPNGDGTFDDKPGAVSLVVLPKGDDPAPQPTIAQTRAICAYLEPRRLITTELYVTNPVYTRVARIQGDLTVRIGYDLGAVSEAVYAALLDFMHPIKGGIDGTGWGFGEDIYHGDLYDLMLGTEGVRRVTGLGVQLEGQGLVTARDFNTLKDGHLPQLERDAIALVARYE
ncbi:MAG: putative baseplate assembly protein [Pseudomonadota bacterium]